MSTSQAICARRRRALRPPRCSARSAGPSSTEALIGQIYLVTVVAAIVGRVVPRGKQAS